MFDRIAAPTTVTAPVASAPPSGEALDRLLLVAVARGSEDAFTQLYRRHYAAVARLAAGVTRDRWAAEDVAQQTFAALWARADRLAAKGVRVRPWLATVARNAAIDQLRATTEPALSLDEHAAAPADAADPAAAAIAALEREDLRRAIASLPAGQRDVVELVALGERTTADAAAALGIPPGTVKSRLRLALKHLRAELSA